MRTPLIASQYCWGRLGAAAVRKVTPSVSSRSTEHSKPASCVSIPVHKSAKISGKGFRAITIARMVSSSCGNACAEDCAAGRAFPAPVVMATPSVESDGRRIHLRGHPQVSLSLVTQGRTSYPRNPNRDVNCRDSKEFDLLCLLFLHDCNNPTGQASCRV